MTKLIKFVAAFIAGIIVTYGLQFFLLSKINVADQAMEKGSVSSIDSVVKNSEANITEKKTPKVANQSEQPLEITNSVQEKLASVPVVSKAKNDKKSLSGTSLMKNKERNEKQQAENKSQKSVAEKSHVQAKTVLNNKKEKKETSKSYSSAVKKQTLKSKKTEIASVPVNKVNVNKNKIKKPVENMTTLNPAIEKTVEEGFGVAYLLKKQWSDNQKPLDFLPSSLNTCTIKNKKLVCNSQVIEEELSGKLIKYKTKSIITRNGTGERFNVVYRNLVLEVNENGTAENSAAVKTGWSEKNTLSCEYTGNSSISCIKNGSQKLVFSGS
ncbi:MAG: hypothetical protein V3U75_07330 [Methylococcaceae bacterium]